MKILTHKVVRDGETIGYKVGAEKPYCICSSGLISKELFMLLINNGYNYFGKMEFEDSSKININDLPELSYDSLSDFERADFFEIKDVMPEEELLQYTTKRETGAVFNWRVPDSYLINTREELLEHINKSIIFNPADPKTYMPLNSFTNPVALFTEEEFDDPANHKIMDIIANRRYYNLHGLFKMSELLPVSGFDPIDFIDAYFAWGIDGLKTSVVKKSFFELDKPLYVRDNFPTEDFYNIGLAYIKKDLTMIPSLKPGWYATAGNDGLRKIAAGIPSSNHGVLVSIKSPTTVKCIRYEFKNFSVEMTPDAMKFKMPKSDFLVKTIRFLTPSRQYLPSRLWNLSLDENKDEIMHILKVESMAKCLAEMIKCKTDVTSIKVYQTLGVATPRAIDTILNIYRDILFNKDGALREEHRKAMDDGNSDIFDEGELSALSMQISMVREVFTHEEDAVPEHMETLYNLCKKVEQGEININNVLYGIKADNSVRLDDIVRHIDGAIKILGLTYEEVFEIIERDAVNVSGDGIVTFTFEGNGIINEFYIPRQNFTAVGFQKDLRSERSRLAQGARNWLFINEIYTEPGQICARHVAVRLFWWPHYLAEKETFVRNIEFSIGQQIITQLLHYDIDIGNDIYQLIAQCICKFGLLGLSRVSLKIREGISVSVVVPPEVCKRIQDTFERRYETTFNITNFMFKNGEPIFYCVNAIVTPYWVVPLGKQRIPTYPLYLAWHFGKEDNARESYEKLKDQGHIPKSSNFYSLKYSQKNFKEENQLMFDTLPGLSLSDYCLEYFTESAKITQKPIHPMDKYYQMVSREEDEYLTRDDFSKGLKHKKLYYSAFCYADEANGIMDVCALDYTGELFDLLIGGKDKFTENSAITTFNGFISKDILSFDDLDSFKSVYSANMGSIYVKAYEKDILLFSDDTAYNSFEVPRLNCDKYAIRRINDRLYLAYFKNGQVLRVDL